MHDHARQCTTTRSSAEQCTQQCSQPLTAVHGHTPRCTGALPWQSRLLSAPSTTGCSNHLQGSAFALQAPRADVSPCSRAEPLPQGSLHPPRPCPDALRRCTLFTQGFVQCPAPVGFLSRPGSALCSAAPPQLPALLGGHGEFISPLGAGPWGQTRAWGLPPHSLQGMCKYFAFGNKWELLFFSFFFSYFAGVVSSYNSFLPVSVSRQPNLQQHPPN